MCTLYLSNIIRKDSRQRVGSNEFEKLFGATGEVIQCNNNPVATLLHETVGKIISI